jgi:uncharacterized protein (TIGR02246 family)
MIDIDAWIGQYQNAWRTDEPQDVGDLFAEDAVYLTAPDADPISGRDAIVAWWRAEEEPSVPDFTWWPVIVTNDTAIVQGRTAYPDAKTYLNLWIISFDNDGRATSFTEWWMVEKP